MAGPWRQGIAFLGVLALVPLTATAAESPPAQIDVSNERGTQAEVGITVDPANPRVLVAGAIDLTEAGLTAMPSYTSLDGGASWKRDLARAPSARYVWGDPALAVGPDGREYYAFLTGHWYDSRRQMDNAVRLVVATRAGPTTSWRTGRAPASRTTSGDDDKPAIAVDLATVSPHYGRVYLAWLHLAGKSFRIVVNHSDDGGLTWSVPVAVSRSSEQYAYFPSLAVSGAGDVYVAWIANVDEIRIARSTDGGGSFGAARLVDTAIALPIPPCRRALGLRIPAQPLRCVTPAPSVVIDRSTGSYAGRVYVTYGAAGTSGTEEDLFVAAFDPSLTPLLGGGARRVQINPPDAGKPSDQFLPASTVDQDTGRLWTCFYDTAGASRRPRAWFSCASSDDGGTTWTSPVRVASTASDVTQRLASQFEFGDYEGVAAAGGVAHPIWTDSRDLKTLGEEIYTTSLAQS